MQAILFILVQVDPATFMQVWFAPKCSPVLNKFRPLLLKSPSHPCIETLVTFSTLRVTTQTSVMSPENNVFCMLSIRAVVKPGVIGSHLSLLARLKSETDPCLKCVWQEHR